MQPVFIENIISREQAKSLSQYLHEKMSQGFRPSKKKELAGAFNLYADQEAERIIEELRPRIEQATGRKLFSSYSYCRIYKKGNILKPHRDRPACEVSATICLDHSLSDENSEYSWPIYFQKASGGPEIEAKCPIGSGWAYMGIDYTHWRNTELPINWYSVLLLHYVDQAGPFAELCKYDSRPSLGKPMSSKDVDKVRESYRISQEIDPTLEYKSTIRDAKLFRP